VDGIRIAGRGTQGVIVFNTAEGERVVSVEHIGDVGGEEESGEEAEGDGLAPRSRHRFTLGRYRETSKIL